MEKFKWFPYKFLKKDKVENLHLMTEHLQKEINNATEFVEAIKRGELDIIYKVGNGETNPLGESLVSMRQQMVDTAEAERQRNWTTEGLAKFSDILRDNNSSLEELASEVISSLVKYLGANQGGFFMLEDEDPENITLTLRACYAYSRKKYLKKEILPGEGLVGQAFLEKRYIYLKEVPQDFVNITSGLGEATPNAILVSPLTVNETTYGILEIATFKDFAQYQIDFIQKIGESIASTIANVKTSERTKRLLDESQKMSEELKSQEEEMRQNMEELQATQEAASRSEAQTRMIFDYAMDAIITIDPKGTIDQFNPAAEKMFGYKVDEIAGKNIKLLMPQKYSSGHDGYLKSYEHTGEKKVIGKAREVEGMRKDGSTFPLEIRIQEGSIGSQTVFIGFLRDITLQKEQDDLIKENQAKARSYFTNSIDAIITANNEGQIIDSNPSATQLFGYGAEQLQQKHFNDIIGGVNLQDATLYLDKKKKVKGIDSQGVGFKTEMFLTVASIGEENIFIAYIRDIQAELKKDKELARSMMEMDQVKTELLAREQELRAYFDNSMDAILHINAKGAILDCNTTAANLFKMDGENPAGFNELVLDVDLETPHAYLGTRTTVEARTTEGTIFSTEFYLTKATAQGQNTFIAYVRDTLTE